MSALPGLQHCTWQLARYSGNLPATSSPFMVNSVRFPSGISDPESQVQQHPVTSTDEAHRCTGNTCLQSASHTVTCTGRVACPLQLHLLQRATLSRCLPAATTCRCCILTTAGAPPYGKCTTNTQTHPQKQQGVPRQYRMCVLLLVHRHLYCKCTASTAAGAPSILLHVRLLACKLQVRRCVQVCLDKLLVRGGSPQERPVRVKERSRAQGERGNSAGTQRLCANALVPMPRMKFFHYCCLLLPPAAACCCLLLSAAACCRLPLLVAAYCCLLPPVAACCCRLSLACCCPPLPAAACCCLLLPAYCWVASLILVPITPTVATY